MDDLRPAFGNRVKAMRKALGLSQEQLAERADLHWTYVSGVERGVRNPSLNIIGRVAAALRVDPAELLKGVGPKARSRRSERLS